MKNDVSSSGPCVSTVSEVAQAVVDFHFLVESSSSPSCSLLGRLVRRGEAIGVGRGSFP